MASLLFAGLKVELFYVERRSTSTVVPLVQLLQTVTSSRDLTFDQIMVIKFSGPIVVVTVSNAGRIRFYTCHKNWGI